MITMVEAKNAQGSLLSLPIRDTSSGIVVADVEGLSPVNAVLVSTSFANTDGSQDQSARRESRNIKLSLDLFPDYVYSTVESLRRRLYAYFMPKSEVLFTFYDNAGPTVNIVGRVETFDEPLFSKEPRAVISVMCFKPDFIDPTPVIVAGETTSGEVELAVPYAGTVETGIRFSMTTNRSLSDFTIYHRAPDGTQRSLEFAAPLISADVLDISTVFGNKGAVRSRSGSSSSLLYAISPSSAWIELQPGLNYIRVYAAGASIPYTITYLDRYGGL